MKEPLNETAREYLTRRIHGLKETDGAHSVLGELKILALQNWDDCLEGRHPDWDAMPIPLRRLHPDNVVVS
ncbi:hypothetical protein IJH02_03665 [Candidatus Saccharibacteria bacterium]|nr:hypothetical protein [Candidatus Saccharibacteria bacterium]